MRIDQETKVPRCSFCVENKATASWSAYGGDPGAPGFDVNICSRCAAIVLPALLADAIALPPIDSVLLPSRASQALESAAHRFWKALTIRLCRSASAKRTTRQKEESEAMLLLAAYPEGVIIRDQDGTITSEAAPLPQEIAQ